jgi:hypothetical protein
MLNHNTAATLVTIALGYPQRDCNLSHNVVE